MSEPIPPDWLPAGIDPSSARILGCDETGRGSLAMLFCAAGVVIPPGVEIAGLRDSKTLSAAKRLELAREIVDRCEVWIEEYGPAQIDRAGIGVINKSAFTRLIERAQPDLAICDGTLRLETPYRFVSTPKGERFACVAAASIVAKVYRDAMVEGLAAIFPGRGLEKAGYPTPENMALYRARPALPWRRRTFRVGAEGEEPRR